MARGRSGKVELLDGKRRVLLLIWGIRNGVIMFDRRACGASVYPSTIVFSFPLFFFSPIAQLFISFGLSALAVWVC